MTNIQNSISERHASSLPAPVMMITAIAVSFYINKELAVVFLIAAPVLGVLLFLIISHVRPLYSKMQKAVDLVNRIIQENLTAIRVSEVLCQRRLWSWRNSKRMNTGLLTTSERLLGRLPEYACHAACHVHYHSVHPSGFGGRLILVGRHAGGRADRFLSYIAPGA